MIADYELLSSLHHRQLHWNVHQESPRQPRDCLQSVTPSGPTRLSLLSSKWNLNILSVAGTRRTGCYLICRDWRDYWSQIGLLAAVLLGQQAEYGDHSPLSLLQTVPLICPGLMISHLLIDSPPWERPERWNPLCWAWSWMGVVLASCSGWGL